jgi:hypothetical protein
MNDKRQERIAKQQRAKHVIKLNPSKLLGKTLKGTKVSGEKPVLPGIKPEVDRL